MNSMNNSEISMKKNNNLLDKFKTEIKELGHYLFLKLKSPLTIIGLGITIFAVIISIFPQILTPYSLTDAIGVYSGSWNPPSPDHPLGQTKFGRDILARIIYAIPNSLMPSISAVLIGLICALIIGIPIALLNKKLNISAEILLIPIFMVPLVFIMFYGYFIFYSSLYDYGYSFLVGLFWTPFFTYLIARERTSFYDISKKVIPYIPLFMGVTILIDTYTGLLGWFSSSFPIQLGAEISIARPFLYTAPWASLFPSLAVFILLSGFFILYAGLQKSPEELQELQRVV